MTHAEVQSYVEATWQYDNLRNQADLVALKLDELKVGARLMLKPHNEAIYCLGANYYRIYLDSHDDIQITPIHCLQGK